MDDKSLASVDRAKEAALRVLLHNAHGPFQGLPRAAGWGYPEPYTRDLWRCTGIRPTSRSSSTRRRGMR